MKEVLLFQSSTSNWQYHELGTYEEKPSFFNDVLPSANFTERYIPKDCLLDSLFCTSVIIK